MKRTIWTIMLAVTLPTLAALGGYEVGRVVGFNEGMTAEQENSRKAIDRSP